jgi:hypothetical protein
MDLIRLRDDAWLLLQTNHYLLLDGWSGMVLLEELLALYAARAAGVPAQLPPVTPFDSFVADQLARDPAAARDYFARTLAGARATRLAGPAQTTAPAYRKLVARLPRARAEALRAELGRHELTESTAVLGAWALAIAGRTRSDDVILGVTSAGRGPGHERVVGLCIATVPLRVRLAPDRPWPDALAALQRDRAEGADHDRLTVGALQRMLGGDGPAFDSVVVLANYPIAPALAALATDEDWSLAQTSRLDLTLNQSDFPVRLDVAIDADLGLALSFYDDRLSPDAAAELLAATLDHLARASRGLDGPTRDFLAAAAPGAPP